MLTAMLLSTSETAVAAAEKGITVNGPHVIWKIPIPGFPLYITESIVVQWFVMAIVLALCLFLTSKLEVIPTTRRQAVAEWIVGFFRGTVTDTMGMKYRAYIPYIAAVFMFSLLSSLMSLLGLRSPTADLSVTGAWAIMTFVLTQYNKFKTGGVKGFFKSFVDPYPFMLPFNIIGEVANPVALALRHFGNLVGGMVIGALIYFALGNFAIGIPAVASLYFDIFSSVMQAYIFIMLTMCYISSADCSE